MSDQAARAPIEAVEHGHDEVVVGVAGIQVLAQAGSGAVGASQAVVDVARSGVTPSASRALRWAVRSWSSVEQRAYPTSIVAVLWTVPIAVPFTGLKIGPALRIGLGSARS